MLLSFTVIGTKGVGRVKHSFCCHEIGVTTDKSFAFQIEKSTKEDLQDLMKDRETML